MTFRLMCTKFLLLATYVILVDAAPATNPAGQLSPNHQWSYKNSTTWKEHFSSCGGAHQSPINLDVSQALAVNYPDFVFNNYDRVIPEMVSNNGHTVMLQFASTDPTSDTLPYITFGGLNERYNFYQLHFHWGRDSIKGSEHYIHGQPYPAELHMVHYNAKYGSFSQALPYPDGLAVLGIMIELQARDNTAFRHIEQFDSILNPDENRPSFLNYAVPLEDLLPDSTRSFYRYNGSLTTPGCNEDVIWTIFDTPIAISERQLAMLRRLRDEEGLPLEDNYRPVQALHDRVLLYRPDPAIIFPTFRQQQHEIESVQAALIARQQQAREQIALMMMG